MKILTIIALAMSFNVLAKISFKNCSKDDEQIIQSVHKDAMKSFDEVIEQIDERVDNWDHSLSKKVRKKVLKAKYILKCAKKRAPKFKYKCNEEPGLPFIMRVLPVVGNTVEVATYGLEWQSYNFLRGAVVHEATHKCGTTDAAYFYQNNEIPRSTLFVEWHNIASTYDYWTMFGFCIPGHDC